ncbi:8114_t:CDS:1, partial [Dentiscutata erythropus]
QNTRNQQTNSSQNNLCQRQSSGRVLVESKQNQSEAQKCYNCDQGGHISWNCSKKIGPKKGDDLNNKRKGVEKENVNISSADVRYFKASETSCNEKEYLRIKIAKEETIFDLRNYNLQKCKSPEMEVGYQARDKRNKINESSNEQ